jgi:hypothetical protein
MTCKIQAPEMPNEIPLTFIFMINILKTFNILGQEIGVPDWKMD